MKSEMQIMDSVIVFRPDVLCDNKGYFVETYCWSTFQELGTEARFVYERCCHSRKGVVRGLYLPLLCDTWTLARAVTGSAFLVVVDLRRDSKTLGKWKGIEISVENRRHVWIPGSFAHGFCGLSNAEIVCSFTANDSLHRQMIRWDDPNIGIIWPENHLSDEGQGCDSQTLEEWLRKTQEGRNQGDSRRPEAWVDEFSMY